MDVATPISLTRHVDVQMTGEKYKLSPQKAQTIPKLKLCAAVLATT